MPSNRNSIAWIPFLFFIFVLLLTLRKDSKFPDSKMEIVVQVLTVIFKLQNLEDTSKWL